jgi:hypothetical protein
MAPGWSLPRWSQAGNWSPTTANRAPDLRGDGIDPHVVQLAGREARWMGKAAKIAEAEGAAMIDINMGCPAKKVTGGYSGSALMRDPDHALCSDRCDRQGGLGAGDIEDAAWLGP